MSDLSKYTSGPLDALAWRTLGGHSLDVAQFPKTGGPQYRPPNTIVLILGTPKKGTSYFGKPI